MDCSEASMMVESLAERRLTAAQENLIKAHLISCDSCASAAYGLEQLHRERLKAVPNPRSGLLPDIVERVTQLELKVGRRKPDRFWLGAATGGALAAGIVLAVLGFNPVAPTQPNVSSPQLSFALNETRNVNVAITSPTEMIDASLRVVLTGTLVLTGYENQSELSWMADLGAGVNALSLPVRMTGPDGGQVMVEVSHEDHHEIFVIRLQGLPSEVIGGPVPDETAA